MFAGKGFTKSDKKVSVHAFVASSALRLMRFLVEVCRSLKYLLCFCYSVVTYLMKMNTQYFGLNEVSHRVLNREL